jgi:branched-chain amino acid transport system substrate-binding protein
MGRRLRWASLAGLSAVLVAGCGSAGSPGGSGAGSGGPLVIGEIAAYTGEQAFEAGFTNSGVLPAIYEINKAGGVLGHKLQPLVIDTKSDPADALTAVEKAMATTPNLVATSGPDSTSGPTVIPILNSHHIPMMITAGEAAYDHSSYAYLWRDLPPDPANGEAMALWAKQQGYTRVATVFGTDTGSQGDLPGVLTGISAVGLKLALKLNETPDQPSYRADVERLIAARPQVIMTETDGATAATFFGELRQLGSLVPIIGTSATPSGAYFNPLRGAIGAANFSKYYAAVVAGTPSPNPAVTVFNDGVAHVKSSLPTPASQWQGNPFSEAGYDGIVAMALAMEAAHSTSGSAYDSDIMAVTAPGPGKKVVYSFAAGKAALQAGKKIQYIGASGPLLFDRWHNSFGSQAVERFGGAAPVVIGSIPAAEIQHLA